MNREFVPATLQCLTQGYSWQLFRRDLIAGGTVGIVSLPLAMAYAIASGVPPERGIYTAIIAGFLNSLLGGSRIQIGGPTGAFIVVIYGVIQRQGYEGLILATAMASLLLVLMGICRLGSLIKYFPPSLITGFTTGIALCVFSSQIKDFFGFSIPSLPVGCLGKWGAYFHHYSSWNIKSTLLALFSLALILATRRFFRKLPWGVTAIILVTLLSFCIGIDVETIGSRFGEIPRRLPIPSFPSFDLHRLYSLLPDALAIALLAGIESLLSALVADQISGERHKSNCELVAQGVANFGSVLMGGIPATGAIARTMVNIHSGAATPVAGMMHAVALFFLMTFLAPLVGHIPLATLSAVLVMVAWNMGEVHRFYHYIRKGIPIEIGVLLSTFLLTLLVDLVVGITAGMVTYGLFIAFQKLREAVVQR